MLEHGRNTINLSKDNPKESKELSFIKCRQTITITTTTTTFIFIIKITPKKRKWCKMYLNFINLVIILCCTF